ncbi:glycosyltransferase [Evansella cellulosilytica]|uniref:Glycosyl transferase group 1 n=1 Tax=Evansella cellulosilytica (strain ATCC 21833 / DSM 2522 / FERM P-1141 / JCM 9156 / N-4) TaxID=649639 RepID=E6TSC3_EVAC2|nr:glycosyltransferase [Evansella cellulosilytica]ADU31892.1 glycosyl transferase group 1 [Evansella cellulosilytica DSM 2522]
MEKKNVLFFIYQMGGGGAARTLLNIINNLDREKFAPKLVTLNFDGSYEHELKSDVEFIKLRTTRLSRSIFSLSKIIKEKDIDIVFSTIPRVNTIAILATRLSFSKAKCVVREADNLGGTFKEDLQLRGFGMMYKLSNQVVSLSEGVKENLVSKYKVKPSHIEVIYNPVDIQHINHKIVTGKVDSQFQPIFETGDKVIITAGRLVEQKDQTTLLKAFAKVNEEISSQLVILGEGPLKDSLISEAKQLNIENRIHFIGFQSNPYIYFKHADVFVLSSIHEGFSHVIAEALATKTPVVSTNCKSGPSEVLNGGEFGYLCPVGSVEEMKAYILKVLKKEKDEVNQMIEHGYRRAHDFDAKKIVKQYEEIFLKTLREK